MGTLRTTHCKSTLVITMSMYTTCVVTSQPMPNRSTVSAELPTDISSETPSLLANETHEQHEARRILANTGLQKALVTQQLSKHDADDAITHILTLFSVHESVCKKYWSDDVKFTQTLAEFIHAGKFDKVELALDRIIFSCVRMLRGKSKIEQGADCTTAQATLDTFKRGMKSPKNSIERVRAAEIYNALMNATDSNVYLHLPKLYLFRYVSLMSLLYHFPMFER